MAVTEDTIMMLAELNKSSKAAFENFYKEHAKRIFSIAFHMLGDRMEAEDLCHDVFLEVMKKPYQFDPTRGSVEAWLAVKTRSRCLDWMRKKKHVVLDDREKVAVRESAPLSTEEAVLCRLDRSHLYMALKRIPASQREALRGMYFESHTQKELSQKLHHPLGTIKSLVRYGVGNLRKQFDQMGWLQTSGGVKKHD